MTSGSGQGQLAGYCTEGNEPSTCIIYGEVFDEVRNCQILKKDPAVWSWLVGWLVVCLII